MAWSAYEALYKVLMNINESGCRPYGMASALMVISVSAWYPDKYKHHSWDRYNLVMAINGIEETSLVARFWFFMCSDQICTKDNLKAQAPTFSVDNFKDKILHYKFLVEKSRCLVDWQVTDRLFLAGSLTFYGVGRSEREEHRVTSEIPLLRLMGKSFDLQ